MPLCLVHGQDWPSIKFSQLEALQKLAISWTMNKYGNHQILKAIQECWRYRLHDRFPSYIPRFYGFFMIFPWNPFLLPTSWWFSTWKLGPRASPKHTNKWVCNKARQPVAIQNTIFRRLLCFHSNLARCFFFRISTVKDSQSVGLLYIYMTFLYCSCSRYYIAIRIASYSHRILTVLLYMVCHGSHQYSPFMFAYIYIYIIYTSTMDPIGPMGNAIRGPFLSPSRIKRLRGAIWSLRRRATGTIWCWTGHGAYRPPRENRRAVDVFLDVIGLG